MGSSANERSIAQIDGTDGMMHPLLYLLLVFDTIVL